jgi:hypothetical protein
MVGARDRSRPMRLAMVVVAATVAVLLVAALPATVKVISPMRAAYRSSPQTLKQLKGQFAEAWTDTEQASIQRLAECPTDPLDPTGMVALAAATRATANSWRETASGASYVPAGMAFNPPGAVQSVKHAARGYRTYAKRGKGALDTLALAFEAMGAGHCASAGRHLDGARQTRQEAVDLYKGAMALSRRQL